MNTAVTRLKHDACFVTVTIDGSVMHAKLIPSRQRAVRISEDELPPSMRSSPPVALQDDQSTETVSEARSGGKQVTFSEGQSQPQLGVMKTIAGAAKMAATHLGLNAASVDQVDLRSRACSGCPKNDLGRCSECGCYLWAKVRQANEKCPIGKW